MDDQVGWAGALLYNERTKRLIDGHARKQLTDPDEPVPVLIGSWNEEAERKILLSLDPIAAMAEANQECLADLMNSVDLDVMECGSLLDHLQELIETNSDEVVGREYDETVADKVTLLECPNCGHKFPK